MSSKALDRAHELLARYTRMPEPWHTDAITLWAAHTHAVTAFDSTPRAAFLSPERGSGKSRTLEVVLGLSASGVQLSGVSPAYIVRKIAAGGDNPPTLGVDEADALFGKHPSERTEEVRALINAGHRQGATVGRAVVANNKVGIEELPCYAPVALAGLGDLPDTIASRAVIVRMQRQHPDDRAEPFRQRLGGLELEEAREGLAKWMGKNRAGVAARAQSLPMPEGIIDRDADVWEPLIAIADEAGGTWPERARRAATEMVRESKDTSQSYAVRLLADIRDVFGEREDRLQTEELRARLSAIEDAPWATLGRGGEGIDGRYLGRTLRPFGVTPGTIRLPMGGTAKGYYRRDFEDAWSRYLPEQIERAVRA